MPQLAELLEQATRRAVADEELLEGSPARERAYTVNSLARWHEIVQRALKLSNRGNCLDIGTSAFTLVLPHFFDETHTLDFTDVMSARCARENVRHFAGGIAAANGEVMAPVPDEAYDCVLFLEVLEHLHLNPVDVLTMLRRKLRPGGTLLLSTPNMMSFGNRIKMLFNRKLNQFHYPPFAENEHPQHGHRHDRVFMPAEMREYFNQTGWSRFQVGFHAMRVSDILPGVGMKGIVSKLVQEPLKRVFPSLRQLMLIEAQR